MSASPRRLPLLIFVLLPLPSIAVAHQVDQYLQATIVAIEPDGVRLSINLTPGVMAAEPVLGLIDGNHDGAISAGEAEAYAELLKRDLTVRVDQRDFEVKLAGFSFPTPADLRTGWGIIRLEFAVAPGAAGSDTLGAGTHTFSLENRHLPEVSAYLFNAARPKSGRASVIRQKRNDNQSAGEIEFTVDPPAKRFTGAGTAVSIAAVVSVVFAAALRHARQRAPQDETPRVLADQTRRKICRL